MDIKKLQTLVIDALEDVKAQDIALFDTTHLTSLFDRIVIVTGTSNRHTKALAASVRDKVKENGGYIVGVEGEDTGEWVLVDLGDMIVHIMQATIRSYYRLEEIWGDKEIKIVPAKRATKRITAESTDSTESAKPAAKKVSRHLTTPQTAEDGADKTDDTAADVETPKKRAPRKTAAAKATENTGEQADKPAPKKRAPAKKAAATEAGTEVPSGKIVKVAATKSAVAAAKIVKARPPKERAAPAPGSVKIVIKRTPAKTKAVDSV